MPARFVCFVIARPFRLFREHWLAAARGNPWSGPRCRHGSPPRLSAPLAPPRSIWGSPLNVKVAVDVVMLATGLLQQQLAGEASSAPSTPRSARFPPSLSPSINGDME